MSVWETPLTDVQGKPRAVDDYQPRVQIALSYKEGGLHIDNNEAIENFARKYAVEEVLVKKAIEHHVDIERREHIRRNQRKVNQQESREKPYNEYDWQQRVIDGDLKKLTVSELEKYLKHHNLPQTGKKTDKVRRIICHVSGNVETLVTASDRPIANHDNDSSSDDSEEEVVIGEIESSEEEIVRGEIESFSDLSSSDHEMLLTTIRSGRVAGSWRNAFYN